MSRRLALDLLQKVNNPSHMFADAEPDEDGVSFDLRKHFARIKRDSISGSAERASEDRITTDV